MDHWSVFHPSVDRWKTDINAFLWKDGFKWMTFGEHPFFWTDESPIFHPLKKANRTKKKGCKKRTAGRCEKSDWTDQANCPHVWKGPYYDTRIMFQYKGFFFICHQSSRTVGLLDVNPEAEQAAVPDRGALPITQAMLSLYILQDWAVSLTAWSFTVHRYDCPHLYHGPQGYCRPPVGHPSYIY